MDKSVLLHKKKRRMFIISGSMIIVGCLVLLFALLYLIQAILFQTWAQEAVGTIYKINKNGAECEIRYFYIVDGFLYEDAQIVENVQVSEETVPVFYMPGNPGNHRATFKVSPFWDFGGNLMLSVLAIGVAAGGIFLLRSSSKNVKI